MKIINSICHIGSQTDYRDESTQTDPYSPAYAISSDEYPEVFTLSDFTYGKGLPVTSLEISFIERLRARRRWKQEHMADMTSVNIVIEREVHQWQMREEEIRMLQDIRQKLLIKNLRTYISNDEQLTQSIVDLFIYRQGKQFKSLYERLETETSREIRRLKRLHRLREAQINSFVSCAHMRIVDMNQHRNDCFSSIKSSSYKRTDDTTTNFQTATPKIHSSCSHSHHLVDPLNYRSRINILKFEELLPKNALIPKIDEPNQLMTFGKNRNKKLHRHIRDLKKATQLIQDEKNKQLSISGKKSLRFVNKIDIIEHFKQPQITLAQSERHKRHHIIINRLQSYLRGIIVQFKILQVNQTRQHLLVELRNGLKRNPTSSLNVVDNEYRNQLASPHTQICDYLEGVTIADVLDFLSKEHFRLQCEQIIHLFILLADRCRYQREATETARRTRSIERQKLEDSVLQQMFSLNSHSDIKFYLEDLILEAISNTADEQARLEIKQITATLADLTDQINDSLVNQSDLEIIVSQLVHEFLFPTVQRILTQGK